MFKKCLAIIICVAVFVSLMGCEGVKSLFSQKGTGGPDGMTENADKQTDIADSGAVPENGMDADIPESEYLLFMRINDNSTKESYDVLELTEDTVTYSYYDYSDPGNPVLKEKTVPFDEILAKEDGRDKYFITIYLFDGVNEFELDLTRDLEEKIREYPEFRETLGTVLGKPFAKPPQDNVITSEDISATAMRNAGVSEKAGSGTGAAKDTGSGENTEVQQPTGSVIGYDVYGELYADNDGTAGYRIEYPQISGLGNESVRKKINDTIRAEALNALAYYKDSRPSADVDISYRIRRSSPCLLSVEYRETGKNTDEPQAGGPCFTVNIDIRTGNRIRLKDMVNVIDGFAIKLFDDRSRAVGGHGTEPLADLGFLKLKELLAEADITKNVGSPEEPHVFSYLTTDSLGISIYFGQGDGVLPAGRQKTGGSATGGRAVYEIGFGDLEEDMIIDETLRGELLSTGVEQVASLDGVEFEGLGQAKLTVGKYCENGVMRLKLLLEERNSGLVYVFPEPTDIPWYFLDLSALEVLDADADGLSDIVAIVDYITGVGTDGAVPFPYAHIYFRRPDGFVRDPELEQEINEEEFSSAEDVARLADKYSGRR